MHTWTKLQYIYTKYWRICNDFNACVHVNNINSSHKNAEFYYKKCE